MVKEESQVAALGVISTVVAVAGALFILTSKFVAIAVLAVLLVIVASLFLASHRRANRLQDALDQTNVQNIQSLMEREADLGSSTSTAALRDQLRDAESKVLEQIAADTDTDVVLASVTELLATQYPGSMFRIINDELFGAETVDRTYTVLPRTETDIGWVLQVNLGDAEVEPDESILAMAQDLARLALDKHRSRSNLRYQADHDALTGLLSRRAVLDVLDASIATRRSVGLVYCDIDKFKEINDTLGHQAGDDLLIGISGRLFEAAKDAPFDCDVGRLGGDEYLIVANQATAEQMVAFVEELSFAIRVPFAVADTSIATSLSLGATFFPQIGPGEPLPDAAELLMESDLALYQVKRSGRDGFRFFDDELRKILEEQRRLQEDLARSIKTNSGIHAMFQPQYNPDRELVGFEALGRWYRQGLGLVSPDEFLGVAAEHGLMADFDFEVFKHICQVLRGLKREGRQMGDVAINVSAERLETPDFVQTTLDVLRRNSIDPRNIVLEITESSLLRDLHERGKRLEELRLWGVRIAIDDFGTGYSSLSYLRELPVDIVKLDKDFVSDIDTSAESRAIVRAILALASALDLAVVAEGVEREEQHEILSELGCDIFQGFLLGRPLDLEVARAEAEKRWSPDPFSSAYEWKDGPPADASSISESTDGASLKDAA